jgi:serine protease Do
LAFCVLTFFLCQTAVWLGAAQAPRGTSKTALPDDPVPTSVVQFVAVGPRDKEQNRACSASGFLIDEEGYLITNAHVVEDAQRCLEKAPGAKILAKLTINDSRTAQAVPCEVVGIDAPNDLALLKTERPLLGNPGGKPPYAMLDAHAVAVGAAVRVTGYPAFSWQPVTQAGQVIWQGRTRLEETDFNSSASDALMVDIHLRPGNSGSPVYRPGGGVIAVVDKRDPLRPAYSVAVAIHYAIELAERHGVRWHAAE